MIHYLVVGFVDVVGGFNLYATASYLPLAFFDSYCLDLDLMICR